jgi:hypothetical protein
MNVELFKSRDELKAELERCEPSHLVAQQIAFIAGIDLLHRLLDRGVTERNARWFLGEMRKNLDMARDVAKRRPNCLLELPDDWK